MIARRHRIIERFLSEVLDLPWDQVYVETKKWENVLSSTTEDAMLKILGNPKTGLFGNPIPYSNYFEGPMDRLCDVDTNKKYSICLLYTSPSPRDLSTSRMPSSA